MLSTVYQNMHMHFTPVICQQESDQSLNPELLALILISGTHTLRQDVSYYMIYISTPFGIKVKSFFHA